VYSGSFWVVHDDFVVGGMFVKGMIVDKTDETDLCDTCLATMRFWDL
jgi:hypothetical protein